MSNTRVFSSVMQDINSLYLPSNERQVQSFKVAFVLLENFSMMSFTAAIDVLITANLVSGETLFEVSSYALKSAGLHNPHYDFNDDILALGASYWAALSYAQLSA